MITEIRNKINTIGDAVTSNFYYDVAPADKTKYCVFSFYGNEFSGDTKDEFQDIYFQVSCYDRLDGLVEALADDIEDAFNSADMSTTSWRCITKRKLRRRAYPLEVDKKSKRLIIEYYIYYEKK